MNTQIISPTVLKVLALDPERRWGLRVLRERGELKEETYRDGLWFIPTDSTQVSRGRNRLEAIQKVAKVKQVIIAHEAPHLLAAPKGEHKLKVPWKGIITGLCASVGLLGTVLAVTTLVVLVGALLSFVVAVAGLVLSIAPMFLLLGAGLLIDPALIVVLESGERILVMTWVE